jgi:dUTP pyrophosphatase
VAPNVYRYPLGFALQIDENEGINLPDSYFSMFSPVHSYHKTNLSIDFRPRSSIYKTGMVLCNSVGTGDRPYTGEYWAYFYHVMPNLPKYEPGDRVAQMKIGITVPIEFEEVDELEETERGNGGFGSTGRK